MEGDRRGRWIVQNCRGVLIRRPLVAVERQGVIAALAGDLAGDAELAVERAGKDRPLIRAVGEQFFEKGKAADVRCLRQRQCTSLGSKL